MADQNGNGNPADDDRYVLEDDGSSVADIEHEMELAAKEAAEATDKGQDPTLRAENADLRDRYLRTLADFENYRKRADREKQDFYKYALADTLRDDLGLTGTKIACNEGHCGACTVLVDGMPVLSCITLVHALDGASVTTIEGLRDHPMLQAFVRADALQCGFCTPGQIVSAIALVEASAEPSSDEIRHAMAGNLCRCGAYPKIEEAIQTWRD